MLRHRSTIYDRFEAVSPSRISYFFAICFISISVLLLTMTLIPPAVMYQTAFTTSDGAQNTLVISGPESNFSSQTLGVKEVLVSFATLSFKVTTANFRVVSSLRRIHY